MKPTPTLTWVSQSMAYGGHAPVLDGEGNILTPATLVNEEYIAGYNNKIYYTTPCN